MHRPESIPLQLPLILLAAVALLANGCDKAGEIADSVSETVSEQVDSVTETVSEQADSAMEAVSAETPATPEPEALDPQALLDQLNSLQSMQITDTLLTQIAATPEAAAQITELRLDGAVISGTGLAAIPAMPNLQTLSIKGVRTSAAELGAIGGSASVQTLDLSKTFSDQSTVEALANMPSLTSLTMDDAPELRTGIGTPLSQMKLQTLSLASSGFADADAAAIAALPLRSLNLSHTQLTDPGLAEIAKIESLEELDVSRNAVKGPAFEVFKNSGLKSLNASETHFGTLGLQAIKAVKSLETLRLKQADIIEDNNGNVFKGLRNLKTLVLSSNRISDRGIQLFLSGHASLEHLELNEMRSITDASLGFLIKNRSLKYLNVTNTTCTAGGMQLFNQKKPQCVIVAGNARLGPPEEADATTGS